MAGKKILDLVKESYQERFKSFKGGILTLMGETYISFRNLDYSIWNLY